MPGTTLPESTPAETRLPKPDSRPAPSATILYLRTFLRRPLLAALALAIPCLAALNSAQSALGQEQTPQIIPFEKKTTQATKKDLGPRALGIVQMTADGKATLVPIMIMIDGKFYDATEYKATPVPMALDSGTVYEGVRSGKSAGLFTVNGALHSVSPNAPVPWLGAGSWYPSGTEAPKSTRKAEDKPVGLEGVDEGPPRLTHGGSTSQPAPASPAPPSPAPTSPSSGSNPSGSGSSSGSAPAPSPAPQSSPSSQQAPSSPSGSAPSSANTPSTSSAPSSAPGSAPSTPSAAPTTGTIGGVTGPQSGQSQASQSKPSGPPPATSDSGADEANRPALRRGKPKEPLPADDVPGYNRVDPNGKPAAPAAPKAPAGAIPPTAVDLIPAISDAAGPEPKAFVYDLNGDDERNRLKQMLAMATDQIRAYLNTQAKETVSAQSQTAGTVKTAGKPAPHAKTAPKGPDPVFDKMQMRAFDLWGNNQPVLVLTAEAHIPPPSGFHPATAPPTIYALALVVRTDIYGDLHQLYSGITDKYHLDITPRLDLIDAVDADGDGRGELLFRETSDLGSGYLVYRAAADSLWKMYDSFNPR